VCAHGSGVIEHDRTETAGIKEAFGAHASKLKISSIKAQVNHKPETLNRDSASKLKISFEIKPELRHLGKRCARYHIVDLETLNPKP
jgi:hypothetical protein